MPTETTLSVEQRLERLEDLMRVAMAMMVLGRPPVDDAEMLAGLEVMMKLMIDAKQSKDKPAA